MDKDDHPELTLESILDFGKHNGEQIEDLIEDDFSYICWMLDKEVRNFDDECMHKIELVRERRKHG